MMNSSSTSDTLSEKAIAEEEVFMGMVVVDTRGVVGETTRDVVSVTATREACLTTTVGEPGLLITAKKV